MSKFSFIFHYTPTNYYLWEIITSLSNSKTHNKTKHNYCLSDVIQIRKVNNIETTYIIGKNVIKSFFKFENKIAQIKDYNKREIRTLKKNEKTA